MSRSRTLFKIAALTAIGFVIPVAMLLPVEYAFSEFGTQPDWNTLLNRYLPPAAGCSMFFLASAITSSTPKKVCDVCAVPIPAWSNFHCLCFCVFANSTQ